MSYNTPLFRTHKNRFVTLKEFAFKRQLLTFDCKIKIMKLQEIVGERIAYLRKEKKISQQKFSYESNLDRTYLTHIEKGRKNISLSTLEKIMIALEISPKEFFNENFN